jgi:hypothetical protein
VNLASRTPFGSQVVARTSETARIAALARRVWTDEAAAVLARTLTHELRTSKGTMDLRPVQAIALYEAMEAGGLFGPMRVGAGKTLVTLLAPFVLEAKRPVLLLPAALVEKTWHDRKALAEHWQLPTNVQIISYEMMGRVEAAHKLEYIRPDLIVADEVHRLKNRRAGVTRRVSRYMLEHPETRFVGVSGTVMKASVRDFAHILRWCLKNGAPIPEGSDEATTWAEALDDKINPLARRQPHAIFDLGPRPKGVDTITAARQVFQSRLLETRGVVASPRTDGVTCSLRVSALEYAPAPVTEQHIGHLRATWTTPDGWAFAEALELRRYVRELALGFHGVWSPRPPVEWVSARRDWSSFVRDTLSSSRTLDTELQVTNAIDAGRLSSERQVMGVSLLGAWRAVRDTFKIQPKPMWHDDAALQACVRWMEKEKGIAWCEHVFFARRLAQLSGAAYYGADGVNERGESITLVKPGKAIIASVAANGTGRNLQMFSSNLVTSCPPGSATIEQLIGRTHRDGQKEDEVTVDILLGCLDHYDAFSRALQGAKAAEATLGHTQKLLLSDICMPNIAGRKGPLWT